MKSNYKKLGPYIREVDIRNTAGIEENLLGVSTQKVFIVSIANTVGTDFSKYKVVKRGQFTYVPDTSRRGDKIGLAMLDHLNEGIVSSAYTVFEIINHNELLPEYLMMWFRRPEFDRYARFMSHGSVREIFGWEEMCDVKLPIPSLEKQNEIVAEYSTILNRIRLNEQLNQKLEETAQAIYKQWFVDFEFPDENGKPYKSSGGKMVWNEELEKEIPKGWEWGKWENIATLFTGFAFKGEQYSFNGGISVVRGENVTEQKLRWDTHKKWDKPLDERMTKCFLAEGDIVIGMDGSKVGKNWAVINKFHLPLLLAQRVACVRARNNLAQPFLYFSMFYGDFPGYVDQIQTGTSVPHISGPQILSFPVLIPPAEVQIHFGSFASKVLACEAENNQEIMKLVEMIDVLLSRIAKQE